MTTDSISEHDAHAIAVDAYIYFYPLVTMDITRLQSTNIEPGKELGKGPMNMFVNVPAYPPADLKVVVRVNFDTLYSLAWLDLTQEAQIVSAPDTAGRTREPFCFRTILVPRTDNDPRLLPRGARPGPFLRGQDLVAPSASPLPIPATPEASSCCKTFAGLSGSRSVTAH